MAILVRGLAAPTTATAQTADHGIAIGGNVSDSTVTVGITSKSAEALVRAATTRWKNLTDAQRNELRRLEKELGVTSGALRTFFATLGENNVSPEMMPDKLGQIAGQYLALRAQLQAAPGNEPEIEKLKRTARTALEKGRLDEADEALRKIGQAQDAALASQLKERVETAKQRATLAMSRLRYKDAAAQYALAEHYAPDDKSRSDYQRQRARTLLLQAEEFNDPAAQAEAIRTLRGRLPLFDQTTDPGGWALARRDLGYALVYRGVERATTSEIDEAIQLLEQARRSGFTVVDRQFRVDINGIYGQVLCDAGDLRHDTQLIKRGAGAYADAIQDLKATDTVQAAMLSLALSGCVTADQVPQQDTKTMLALREYSWSALKKTSKETDPFGWADRLNTIAALDFVVGHKEKSPELMFEASELYRRALDVISVDRSPERWRETEYGLATALVGLHKYRTSVAPLEEAMEIFDALSADARSQPGTGRIDLEPERFITRAELGLAHANTAMVQRALDDLRSDGLTVDTLDADDRKTYEALLAKAKAFVAGKRQDPTRAATLSLIQLEVGVPPGTAAQAKARIDSFVTALKNIHRCRDAGAVAKSLGATVVVNDAVPASQLPPRLRDMLAALEVGSATQPFGSSSEKVRSLVLCGRAWDATAAN